MRFHLGQFTLDVVSDGRWRLDGGMMFGIVPKVLWERAVPADEKNRIPMGLNCLLVRTGRDVILVDTGIGDTGDEKFRQIYAIERSPTLLESLAACGVRPEDVTLVINSHLHFDHAGTNTCYRGGRLVPTFPRARYVVQRGEYEHARQPLERDRASYRPVTWEPLEESGHLDLIEGDRELVPGVQVIKVGGHNRDLQCIILRSGGETAIFWADLIPLTHHVALPWIMALDLYPVHTLEQKRRLIPQAAREGWLCFFYHDTQVPAGRIVEREGKFQVIPVTGDIYG
jgi:glyoxylase-like metal-dependent hydrolase (beta-lactamase superfamily II)